VLEVDAQNGNLYNPSGYTTRRVIMSIRDTHIQLCVTNYYAQALKYARVACTNVHNMNNELKSLCSIKVLFIDFN